MERNLLALDLAERRDDRLERTLVLGLDDDVKLKLPFSRHARHKGVQRRGTVGGKSLSLLLLSGLLRKVAGTLLVEHNSEFASSLRYARKSGDLDRRRRRSLLYATAAVVNERTDLAEMFADEDRIADLKGSAGDENRGARTKPLLELRLDDKAIGTA